MTERMSRDDFLSKVEWEGGIYEVLQWGMRADDVPEEIEVLWQKLEQAFDVYKVFANEIWDKVEQWDEWTDD